MGRSGLFCIASPLQAICAVEAVREYAIEDLNVIVINDNLRINQIKSFLEYYNINYSVKVYKGGLKNSFLEFAISANPFVGKYDYLFIGNFLSFSLKMRYLPYVKNHGKIIYLDDGASTLSIANNEVRYTKPMKLRSKWTDFIIRSRSISDNNFFTFFADDIKRDDWLVKKNKLTTILNKRKLPSGERPRYVMIIGTATEVYCDYLGIDIQFFLKKLRAFLNEIRNKYVDYDILYIPHGRDRIWEIRELCKEENIIYKAIEECVEMFVVNYTDELLCVYGFSSTALKTIHVVFPNIPIINLLILEGKNKKNIEEYLSIAETYEKDGIIRRLL